jgi:hypothetical protein
MLITGFIALPNSGNLSIYRSRKIGDPACHSVMALGQLG